MKFHTEEQCIVKMEAIQQLLNKLKLITNNSESKMIIENIEQMLNELRSG